MQVFVGFFFEELDGERKLVKGPRFYWTFRAGNQCIKADPHGEKSPRLTYQQKPQEGMLYMVKHKDPNENGFCEIWQIDPVTVADT